MRGRDPPRRHGRGHPRIVGLPDRAVGESTARDRRRRPRGADPGARAGPPLGAGDPGHGGRNGFGRRARTGGRARRVGDPAGRARRVRDRAGIGRDRARCGRAADGEARRHTRHPRRTVRASPDRRRPGRPPRPDPLPRLPSSGARERSPAGGRLAARTRAHRRRRATGRRDHAACTAPAVHPGPAAPGPVDRSEPGVPGDRRRGARHAHPPAPEPASRGATRSPDRLAPVQRRTARLVARGHSARTKETAPTATTPTPRRSADSAAVGGSSAGAH